MKTLLEAIDEAREKFGEVTPCGNKTWEQSITTFSEGTILWFNDPIGSTHLIKLTEP